MKIRREGAGYRFDQNGWIYLHIQGSAEERGYQHGALLAPEIGMIIRSLKYLTYWNTGKTWEFFVEKAGDIFSPHMDEEFLTEIKGIGEGAAARGLDIRWQEILAWNGYEELTDYWWPIARDNPNQGMKTGIRSDRCSAFMAHGTATGGKIVMAHNSWDNFETGQFSNLILDIEPDKGCRMFMQSAPGYIDSFADFFVTSAGIMGTETTIGGFSQYDPDESPEFNRIRRAMQYGRDLDDFSDKLKKQNNGGYANSWLLGDIHRGDIMRLELGLKYTHTETNPDCGYFIGFNAPYDPRIRNLECSNTGFADIRRHQGARQVRLADLMDQYHGNVDVEIGKTVLADHYDVYLKKENPCSRTVDGHYELDAREYMSQADRPLPFQPRGTVDGKVCDSDMASEMAFWARWGNSSGMPFDAESFLKEHRQWDHLSGYLHDRPARPWTEFRAGQQD